MLQLELNWLGSDAQEDDLKNYDCLEGTRLMSKL